MNLNAQQRAAILAARTRDCLAKAEVLIVGDLVAATWYEADQQPAERWRGQLVKDVRDDGICYTVVWTGCENFGKTRRSVIAQLVGRMV